MTAHGLERLPALATTGIGSLPLPVPEAAAHAVGSYEIPFCPQLPRIDGDMIGEWLGSDPGRCGWSPDRDRERPAAWEAFLGELDRSPPSHGWVKLQVTGPITLATALRRSAAEPVRVRETLALGREVSAWLAASVAGQAAAIRERGLAVMLFVDEPGLAATGLAPADADVWAPLRFGAVGAPAFGIHVCGAVPWPLLDAAAPELISFDLHRHGVAPEAIRVLRGHLRRGGRIAWGALPATAPDGAAATSSRLGSAIGLVCSDDLTYEAVAGHSLLTPSCGTGRLSGATERLVAETLSATARAARAPLARPQPGPHGTARTR